MLDDLALTDVNIAPPAPPGEPYALPVTYIQQPLPVTHGLDAGGNPIAASSSSLIVGNPATNNALTIAPGAAPGSQIVMNESGIGGILFPGVVGGAPTATFGDTTNLGRVMINGPTSSLRVLDYATAGSLRFRINLAAGAESGGNAGSNLNITPYDDNGNALPLALTITRASSAVRINGTNTNDNPGIGYVGEAQIVSVLAGSAVALATGTVATIGTLSLTAGDWDVGGQVGFTGTTNQCSLQIGGINQSAVMPNPGNGSMHQLAAGSGIFGNCYLSLAPVRMALAATTTVYLLGSATFATGAASAFGWMKARRQR